MVGKTTKVGACLYVGDLKTMVRFYHETLGLETSWDGGDFAEFETASGALSLFLYSRRAFVEAIGQPYVAPQGINQTCEIAFWLPTFAEVDAEYERLATLGVPFPTGAPKTYPFGIRNFYVADPEGNLLEIGSMCQN